MSDEHPTTTPTEENQGENSEDWTCIEEKLDALIELFDAVETKLASVETALNQVATKADFSEATETLMKSELEKVELQHALEKSNKDSRSFLRAVITLAVLSVASCAALLISLF